MTDQMHDIDPPWLMVAKLELGTKETPGSESNPEVLKYYKATTLGGHPDDSVPWCSAFANWCFEQAGYRGTRRANARSWSAWGEHLDEPKRGAVVVFWRGDPHSAQGHVGFYLGTPRPHVLSVLSGNASNRVGIDEYGTGRVLAYRYPRDLDKVHR